MSKTRLLKELKTLGTAQNRKVYARHGVQGTMFGVSYANLGKLKQRIKCDHELAEGLWASGNHDARVLAAMIADPAAATVRLVDSWAKDLHNYVLTDALVGYVAQTRLARSRAEKWIKSRNEWLSAAGWGLVSGLTSSDLPDAYFAACLDQIESRLPGAPNRTRHSMNGALISIGLRSAGLRRRALAVAKCIGVVAVDHGETGCKTPDAATYIARTLAHRTRKTAAGSTPKKKAAHRRR